MYRFIDLYLSLQGRASRRDYWLYWMLPSTLIAWAYAVASETGLMQEPGSEYLFVLVLFTLTWPGIAVSVKRWHDIDVSGWWVLIGAVPYVGWLILLVFNGFSRGTIGTNRFGPDPIRDSSPTSSSAP